MCIWGLSPNAHALATDHQVRCDVAHVQHTQLAQVVHQRHAAAEPHRCAPDPAAARVPDPAARAPAAARAGDRTAGHARSVRRRVPRPSGSREDGRGPITGDLAPEGAP